MPVKSSYCNHHFAQHTKRWQWHTFISNTNFALIQSRVKYFRLADAIKFFLFVFRTNIASIFVVTINKDFRAFARMYEMLMLVLREKHGHLSEKALKFFEKVINHRLIIISYRNTTQTAVIYAFECRQCFAQAHFQTIFIHVYVLYKDKCVYYAFFAPKISDEHG